MQTTEERLRVAARNAVLGDGHLWKHPTAREYKAVWTSVDLDWLREKQRLFGDDVASSTITIGKARTGKGIYPNAKPIHTLRSYVHPIFTQYKHTSKSVVLSEVGLVDVALWYLDDGCLIQRKDGGSYRFILCVGDVRGIEEDVLAAVRRVTGLTKVGSIRKNNSRATEGNKSLYLTIPAGEIICGQALHFCPPSMRRKVPSSMFNDQTGRS